MKTIYDYLHPEGKFDHILLDEMIVEVRKTIEEASELSDKSYQALFRFGMLIFHYLDKKCNPEDFSFESFYKLLYCETEDEDRKEGCETVLDVLLCDARSDETLYTLAQFWYNVNKHFPDNADELYRVGFRHYCESHKIQWDDDVVKKVKALREASKKEVHHYEMHDERYEAFLKINDFLFAFEGYNRNRTVESYDTAKAILESFPKIAGIDLMLYDFLCEVLEKAKIHGPVFKIIDARYMLKK